MLPSIPVDDLTAATRARFEEFRADEILELKQGAYGASHVAIYCGFAQPQSTGDWNPLTSERDDPLTSAGNPADI